MVMAGGTGGHIFPALAVAEALRALGVPVLWLGSRHGPESEIVPRAGFPFTALQVSSLRGQPLFQQLLTALVLVRNVLRCLVLIARTRPAAILGMGGYASGPGGLAAWLMRVPLLIHEQNAVPGLTNRVLARLARRCLESFPGTFGHGRGMHTGNPVRAAVVAVRGERQEAPSDPDQPLRLLVMGGSQGARVLNQTVPSAVALVKPSAAIAVWHQVGRLDQGDTRRAYAAQGLEARVEPFIEDMAAAYRWADLVVCRAGASTVFELAAAGIPAILAPYPFAVDDHQTANARYLAERGAAVLMPQAQLDATRLAALLASLCADRARLAAMARAATALATPDAAGRVARQCLEVALA